MREWADGVYPKTRDKAKDQVGHFGRKQLWLSHEQMAGSEPFECEAAVLGTADDSFHDF